MRVSLFLRAGLLALAATAAAGDAISLRGLEANVTTTVPAPTTTTPAPTTVTPTPTTVTPAPTDVTTAPAPTTATPTTSTPAPTVTQATQAPQPTQPTQPPQPTQPSGTPAPPATTAATTGSSSSSGKTSTPRPSTPKPTKPSEESDSSMGTGAVIGIVAGIVCGIGLLAALFYICVKKKQTEDDDPLSPNEFANKDVTPVYSHQKPVTPVQRPVYTAATTATASTASNNYSYGNEYAYANNSTAYQQPTAPAAIAAAAAAHTQYSNDMYGQTSPQEFYDRESATSSEPSNHSGKNAWMQAMRKPSYDSDGVDIDRLDTNSYNSAKFDDSNSDVSRDSSFLSRDESLGSSFDDFPAHRDTKQERGSYEL
ncbi:hypothetical protein ACHHYP_14265 [Achlya hypogyna]|uniref:Secreted protein n=1 Tax=Achlya hypogyna TaxID=1202772 RepID=A0A1V9YDK2_ACHHY|nr:hypothetical protein ACHHYP_14265 [Achlya hypogyna]